MREEVKRFERRFESLFKEHGLLNIKFFLSRKQGSITLADFIAECNKIQDTITAGDYKAIGYVDKDMAQKKFDAPF